MLEIDPRKVKVAALMANAILTKAALVAGGYFLGVFLDKKFGTTPYLMVTLLTLGLALGIWWLLWIANKVKF